MGSLICGAKIKFFAQNYDKNGFDKLQITRLLDDWAYQANVRQGLETSDIQKLNAGMKDYEKLSQKF